MPKGKNKENRHAALVENKDCKSNKAGKLAINLDQDCMKCYERQISNEI